MKSHLLPNYLADVLKPECRFAEVTLSHRAVGDLLLPTGRLVACDPVAYPETEPFSLALPRGRFPVLLSVASTSDDQRVAFAMIQFRKDPPVRWETLVLESSVTDTDSVGFGVDSGIAGFMDYSTVAAMKAKEKEDQQSFYAAMDAEMKKTEVPTWSWLNVPFGEGNLVAFSPGYGDGEYVTYAGFDLGGAVAVVVTDFCVVQSDANSG
jgi:hypothetical protein